MTYPIDTTAEIDISGTQARFSNRAGFAAILGNAFEFFDFTVYALFAVTIGKQFFPVTSETGQLLLSLATFGIGFVMRPLGAMIIGAYADRVGRKAALTLTIMLMVAGTAIIGLTPSYQQIGLMAPILIIIARLLQGFSAGGEMGAATAYLLELAPAGRRGFYGSWQITSQNLATMTGALMGVGLITALSPDDMDNWGWRIPFLFGLLIGPVGFYIRKHMDDTIHIESVHGSAAMLLKTLVWGHRRLFLTGIFVILGFTVSTYINNYMTTYALRTLHMPANIAMVTGIVTGLLSAVGAMLGGWLSDRFGRRLLMLVPRILFVLAIYPAYSAIIEWRTPGMLLGALGFLSLLMSMSGAVSIVALTECFPRSIRSSGLSLTYATSVTVFGGSTQLIVTWLLEVTGSPIALAWYLIAANVITIVAMFALQTPKEQDILE